MNPEPCKINSSPGRSFPDAQQSLLDIDNTAFRSHFPYKPFLIGHHLQDSPLFALPRLVQLAASLPAADVEYNEGNLPVNMDGRPNPSNGLSAAETIRRIEECGSWMVIKNVERDPEYAALLNRLTEEALATCENPFPGVIQRAGFIFVSSPKSVTPFHLDREHNFLLQIRGSKEVCLFDRGILTGEEIETQLYGRHHRNMAYRNSYEERGTIYSLGPGNGVHFPVLAPHWVKVGSDLSISFSFTFRSQYSEEEAVLYLVNGLLRKIRVSPVSPGESPSRDRLKISCFHAVRQARKLVSLDWRKKS